MRDGYPEINPLCPGGNLFDHRRILELETALTRRDPARRLGRGEDQRQRQQQTAGGTGN